MNFLSIIGMTYMLSAIVSAICFVFFYFTDRVELTSKINPYNLIAIVFIPFVNSAIAVMGTLAIVFTLFINPLLKLFFDIRERIRLYRARRRLKRSIRDMWARLADIEYDMRRRQIKEQVEKEMQEKK